MKTYFPIDIYIVNYYYCLQSEHVIFTLTKVCRKILLQTRKTIMITKSFI